MKKLIALVLAAMLLVAGISAMAETKGTLTMATNAQFPPYEYYDEESGEIVGIDVEIAKLICEKIGYDLEIADIDFDAVIPGVQTAKYDFGASGITMTEERAEIVDFTDSYTTAVQVVIVPADSEAASIDDIVTANGTVTIGVQMGTTGDLYSTWDYEDEGKGAVNRYKSGAAAVEALVSGKVDCVVVDSEPAKNFVAAKEGLKILETAYALENYAMVFPKGSEIYADFNAALNALIEDGSLQAIVEKYIPAEAE